MNFSQKIYFNDKQLIVTTNAEAYTNDHPEAEDFTFYSGATTVSFTKAVQRLERPGTTGAIIEDASSDALTDQLSAMYHIIDAGGGLVYNEQGEILMIFRRGKWDLPKGKLDNGEDIAACALREVKEETGLANVTLGDKIGETYHIYTEKNEQILKRSTWYKMHGTSTDQLNPQKEENILEARWISMAEVESFLEKSYTLIRDVLEMAGEKS